MLAKKLFTIDIDRETRATLNVKNENINNRPFHDLCRSSFCLKIFKRPNAIGELLGIISSIVSQLLRKSIEPNSEN